MTQILRMPLIPLANCLVQSTSFPHASIRLIRSIRDTSCRSSCCRFPSRSLRLCERQKPFSPPFSLCSLKTRSQLSASNVPSFAFIVPRLVSLSLREVPYSLPFLQLPTRNSEEPELLESPYEQCSSPLRTLRVLRGATNMYFCVTYVTLARSSFLC